MGWTFVRLTRDQLIRELQQRKPSGRARGHRPTLVGNVLWTVVRVTQAGGVLGLAPGESATLIGCHLLESEGRSGSVPGRGRAPVLLLVPAALSRHGAAASHLARTGACLPPAATDQRGRRCSHRRTWTPSCRPCRPSCFASSKTSWPTTRLPTTSCTSTSSPTAWAKIRRGEALTYRAYLRHVFLEGFTPILKGHEGAVLRPAQPRLGAGSAPIGRPSTARFFIPFTRPCSAGLFFVPRNRAHPASAAGCRLLHSAKEIVMQLASRFASRSPVLRADHPLSDDQIRTGPVHLRGHPARKPLRNGGYIPTAAVLTELRKGRLPAVHGVPDSRATRGSPRYTKHMLRLHASQINGAGRTRSSPLNLHDSSS